MDLTVFIGLNTELKNPEAVAHTEKDDDLHITLVYGTQKDASIAPDEAENIVLETIEELKDEIPDEIKLDETGLFPASSSSDGKEVVYARVEEGQLEKLHDVAVRLLKDKGLDLEFVFDEYRPHMTLGYVEPGMQFRSKPLDVMVEIPKAIYGVCASGKELSPEQDKEFAITKSDEDQRLVFGWASVSERTNGEVVCDLQGDMVSPQELENAVYEYVLNWHTGGEEHDPMLQNKCRMVESVVFTEEKLKAMGIPEGIVPLGWWIGFKVDDPQTWELVKNGTYQMFSIAGHGKRVPEE